MAGTTASRRVLVLGNFSGRNVGDIAILGNLLAQLGRACPGTEFMVPTLRPGFLRRRFPDSRVHPIGVAPWHGSLKLLGLPVARAVRSTDLVLVTDALLFDADFFNPLHNYLSTLALVARWCRRKGTPMVVYHGSLGPITTARGARALCHVLAAGPVIILRDRQSRALIERLDLPAPPIMDAADCALATDPPPPEAVTQLMRRLGLDETQPWLGWNVSPYIGTWNGYPGPYPHRRFAELTACVLDELVRQLGIAPLLVVTQRMDLRLTRRVQRAMRHGGASRIVDATALDYREVAGLLGRLGLVVAMRTHALVLAAAGGAPVFNINAYPKSGGFMESIRQERCQHELSSFNAAELVEQVTAAWDHRLALRARVRREVTRERPRAYAGVPVVQRLLGLPSRSPVERGSGSYGEAYR